jgi:hypothetical protein
MDWMVPDPTIHFWRRALPMIGSVIEEFKPCIMLTTSPWHATHAVGLALARNAHLPWVADFRDPYLIDARFRPRGVGKLWIGAHRRFERSIYETAALATHAIPLHARWARITYAFARQRIRVLTNGYPPELDVALQNPVRSPKNCQSVRIVGYPGDTIAVELAQSIAGLVSEGLELELRLVGRQPTTLSEIQRILGQRAVITGRLAHYDALRQLAGGDVLVCPLDIDRSAQLRLSSKLFEYLGTGKPILLVNPTRSDRQLVRGLKGVETLFRPNSDEWRAAIRRALAPEASPPPEQVARIRAAFNRRDQVAQLAAWLDELLDNPRRQG